MHSLQIYDARANDHPLHFVLMSCRRRTADQIFFVILSLPELLFAIAVFPYPGCIAFRMGSAVSDDLIDQAVRLGFLCGEEVVALGVQLHLFQRLAGVLC